MEGLNELPKVTHLGCKGVMIELSFLSPKSELLNHWAIPPL